MKKERESNFELLRVLAMFMVITVHYIGHGGALKHTNIFSINFYYSNIIESFARFSVPLYTCIGSYFMVSKEANFKKLIKLWGQVVFYSVGLYFFLFLMGYIEFNLFQSIKSILPIIMNQYGFVTAYFILMILSPFLNKFILSLDRLELKKLVIILFVLFIVFGAGFPVGVITNSYIALLIIIYLFISYIKLYVSVKKIHKKYILLYLFSVFGIFSLRMLLYKIGLGYSSDVFVSYNSTLIIIGTFSLFMFFRTIKIQSKFINKVASLTFGVYLIHDNNYVRDILYTNILNTQQWFNSDKFLFITIVSIVSIYVICSFIEYCRIKIFNLLNINKHIEITVEYIFNKYISKIKNIENKMKSINDN